MVIVSGWLRVAPDDRSAYLESSLAVIEAARAAPGCIDFHLGADPIEDDRINIFEQWESTEAVDNFRGSGPGDDQQSKILDAHVEQHEIADTTTLT